MDLTQALNEVDALPPQQRGGAFEDLIGRVFELAQFFVTPDAGTARPRQTDLVARLGRDRYLIEVKHQTRAADVDVVDSLRSRLQRTDPRMIGVLISRSGFTTTAVAEVEQRRERSVLLLDGGDVERVMADPESVRELLEQRHEDLLLHGRVVGDRRRPARRSSSAPATRDKLELVDLNGAGQSWTVGAGGYETAVQSLELFDIDWTTTPGFGVSLEAQVPCDNQEDLVAVLQRLAAAGWVSEAGAWSVEQSERNWRGLGSETLIKALGGWRSRYSGLGYIHHREIVAYSDQRGVCVWTLHADLQAADRRRVWNCALSFHFPGVPLDTDPLRSLLSSIGASTSDLHFRPRGAPAVESWHPPRRPGPKLEVTGFVVESRRDEQFVRGILAANPLRRHRASGLPDEVKDSDHLILDLRSWHDWGDRPAAYRLIRVEWMRTANVVVARATADWDSPLRSAHGNIVA